MPQLTIRGEVKLRFEIAAGSPRDLETILLTRVKS